MEIGIFTPHFSSSHSPQHKIIKTALPGAEATVPDDYVIIFWSPLQSLVIHRLELIPILTDSKGPTTRSRIKTQAMTCSVTDLCATMS